MWTAFTKKQVTSTGLQRALAVEFGELELDEETFRRLIPSCLFALGCSLWTKKARSSDWYTRRPKNTCRKHKTAGAQVQMQNSILHRPSLV